MKDAKGRILARRSAFIAAAALTASCDRCSSHPTVCLSVEIQDSGGVRPLVCLSAPPHACLAVDPDSFPPDASADGGREGGAITLAPIDITTKDAATVPPTPRVCLSVAVPTPPPRVCLRRLR